MCKGRKIKVCPEVFIGENRGMKVCPITNKEINTVIFTDFVETSKSISI
jgi:hypothetical protein